MPDPGGNFVSPYPHGAGDAVADRQHLADFRDLGLLTEILDLLLEDRGDFCGADVHQPTSFIACLRAWSLVRSELSKLVVSHSCKEFLYGGAFSRGYVFIRFPIWLVEVI